MTKTGYVIAKVNESKPQTVKPLDAVKDDIKARLQQDKARTLAFEAANAERKTFTADLPKELQGKLKKTEPVGRQGYMGELGMNAELTKAAFTAKVNDWLPVAYTLDGRRGHRPRGRSRDAERRRLEDRRSADHRRRAQRQA